MHRIIARGFERRKIFQDGHEPKNVLDRLGKILNVAFEQISHPKEQGVDVGKIARRVSELLDLNSSEV